MKKGKGPVKGVKGDIFFDELGFYEKCDEKKDELSKIVIHRELAEDYRAHENIIEYAKHICKVFTILDLQNSIHYSCDDYGMSVVVIEMPRQKVKLWIYRQYDSFRIQETDDDFTYDNLVKDGVTFNDLTEEIFNWRKEKIKMFGGE